jgi:hypothetical protein
MYPVRDQMDTLLMIFSGFTQPVDLGQWDAVHNQPPTLGVRCEAAAATGQDSPGFSQVVT